MEIWNILNIDPTKDISTIKKAYAKKLKIHHPEDDPKGYQKLREAYDKAVEYTKKISNNTTFNDLNRFEIDIEKQSATFMIQVESLYNDFFSRIDIENWKTLLNHDIVWNINNKPIISNLIIEFLLSHRYLPKDIWILLDSNFHWCDEETSIHNFYNDNFIKYIQKQINSTYSKSYSFFKYKEGVNYEKFLEYHEKAENYFYEDNLSSAYLYINHAKDIYSEDPCLLCLEGKLFLRNDNINDAIYTFNKVLNINPKDSQAIFYRATAYYEGRHTSEFLNDYKVAYSKLPESNEILVHMAKSYFKIGHLEKARKWCLKLMKTSTSSHEVKSLIAQIYTRLRKNITKELEKNPSDKNLRLKLDLINSEISINGKGKLINFFMSHWEKLSELNKILFKGITCIIVLSIYLPLILKGHILTLLSLIYFAVFIINPKLK